MWLNLLLINSPSVIFMLGYHGVWIRTPTFLQISKELFLQNKILKIHSPPGHFISIYQSWYQHRINLLVLGILYVPVHITYMNRQATWYATVACLRWQHFLIVHIPVVSSSSAIGGQYHSTLAVCHAVIPVITLATLWWNTYITFSTAPVITQISLPYNITDWTTALYIISRARYVAPVFATTFTTIAHRCRSFWRFWYMDAQSLLL